MDAREAMLAKRAEVLADKPAIEYASELAPLMGEHEREFWNWKLETYFADQGV